VTAPLRPDATQLSRKAPSRHRNMILFLFGRDFFTQAEIDSRENISTIALCHPAPRRRHVHVNRPQQLAV
jgi:hypothetical protein